MRWTLYGYDAWKTGEPAEEAPARALCEACGVQEATQHVYCDWCYREHLSRVVQQKADELAEWAQRYGEDAMALLIGNLGLELSTTALRTLPRVLGGEGKR